MMQLSQIAEVVNGTLLGNDSLVQGVSIDTRSNCEGRLFVALNGENFDAHDFLDKAEIAGAAAAVIERNVDSSVPTIKVEDTHRALSQLAAWWRTQFAIPVIGVTGSVGKTSVKEMLGVIFSQLGRGVVTHGNLNNEIGVPLTLMRLIDGDRYAVVEMGMNHAGEISRITAITQPTIALINNAAAAHLEGLGTIDAVADAKGEIFEGLSDDGIAIINADDQFASKWLKLVPEKRLLTFGLEHSADVSANYEIDGDALLINVDALGDAMTIRLSAIGEHNVRNALAAVAVSIAANVPIDAIRDGLERYRPISGRLNIERVGPISIIDDTYNANPVSMKAAIETLARYPDNTLIVGDMGELGEAAKYEHKRLGQIAKEAGIQTLLVCGEYADLVAGGYGPEAHAFGAQAELIEYALATISEGTVLVKGSRFMRMENVVGALSEKNQNENTECADAQNEGAQ